MFSKHRSRIWKERKRWHGVVLDDQPALLMLEEPRDGIDDAFFASEVRVAKPEVHGVGPVDRCCDLTRFVYAFHVASGARAIHGDVNGLGACLTDAFKHIGQAVGAAEGDDQDGRRGRIAKGFGSCGHDETARSRALIRLCRFMSPPL